MTPEDLKQLEAKAEQGDADAQYKLARTLPNWPNESSYHTFPGDPFSNSRTEQLLERAADQGHVEAQTDLGVAYFLEKKYHQADIWLYIARKNGPFSNSGHYGSRDIDMCFKSIKPYSGNVKEEAERRYNEIQNRQANNTTSSPA